MFTNRVNTRLAQVLCALTLLHFSPFQAMQGAEVRFMAVTKGFVWEQQGTGAPVQETGDSFRFRAHVELARPNAIGSASLTFPAPVNATRPLNPQGIYWEYAAAFSMRSALNNNGPNGTYTFVTQSALDGKRTNVVTLSSDIFPIAARVANFVEAQGVDSKTDFTLRWDPAGTGANGFVHVRIFSGEQIVFQSPTYPQAVGALNGSSGSVLIPRNTLVEGTVYRGEITIWRRVTEDLKGYPGVAAWAAYTQTTKFTLRTEFSVTDVHWFGFAKTQRYQQTSANAPFLNVNAPLEFTAFADATAAANISAASVSAGTGAAALINSAGSWRITEGFATQQALDVRFPVAVALTIQTAHNGVRNLTLSLPIGAYPTAPQISNFNEANAIDSTKPFVLRWNALAGGTVNDFMAVQFKKGGTIVLRSGDHPSAAGALNGTSTSFNVPANLLAPGEACEVSIFFLKASTLDTFSYPKALGIAGFARQTTATIRARGGNVTTPHVRNVRKLGGTLEFDFAADQGRQYVVQGSPDFSRWTDLLTTNAPNSNPLLRVNIDPLQRQQNLRLLAY